jgi:hypothetical protein
VTLRSLDKTLSCTYELWHNYATGAYERRNAVGALQLLSP